jgi:hypothetical protein
MHVMMKNDDDDMILPAPPAPKAGGGAQKPALPVAWELMHPAGGGSTRVPGTRSSPTLLGGVSACTAAHNPWRSVLLVGVRRIPTLIRARGTLAWTARQRDPSIGSLIFIRGACEKHKIGVSQHHHQKKNFPPKHNGVSNHRTRPAHASCPGRHATPRALSDTCAAATMRTSHALPTTSTPLH